MQGPIEKVGKVRKLCFIQSQILLVKTVVGFFNVEKNIHGRGMKDYVRKLGLLLKYKLLKNKRYWWGLPRKKESNGGGRKVSAKKFWERGGHKWILEEAGRVRVLY